MSLTMPGIPEPDSHEIDQLVNPDRLYTLNQQQAVDQDPIAQKEVYWDCKRGTLGRTVINADTIARAQSCVKLGRRVVIHGN